MEPATSPSATDAHNLRVIGHLELTALTMKCYSLASRAQRFGALILSCEKKFCIFIQFARSSLVKPDADHNRLGAILHRTNRTFCCWSTMRRHSMYGLKRCEPEENGSIFLFSKRRFLPRSSTDSIRCKRPEFVGRPKEDSTSIQFCGLISQFEPYDTTVI